MHEIIPQLGRIGSDGLRHSIHDTIQLAVLYAKTHSHTEQIESEVRANIEAYVDERIKDDRKEQREKLRQQWERTWDEFNTSPPIEIVQQHPPAGTIGGVFKDNKFAVHPKDEDVLSQ
jgi:hypothetical protein